MLHQRSMETSNCVSGLLRGAGVVCRKQCPLHRSVGYANQLSKSSLAERRGRVVGDTATHQTTRNAMPARSCKTQKMKHVCHSCW